jgi:hypothetical protein
LLKKASQTAGVVQDEKVRSVEGVGQYGNYSSKFHTFFFVDSLGVMVLMRKDADVPASEIYGSNAKKLEELKHKYDPENLFDRGTRLIPRPLVVVN